MPVFEGGWFAPRSVSKVLLVDDDDVVLATWRRVCQRRGTTPLIARTADEALRLAATEKPDTAVIDFFLGNGTKAIDIVARLAGLVLDIYIVVVSGKLFLAANELGPLVHAGAHDCLSKTIGLERILAGIEAGVRPAIAESDALLTPEQVQRVLLEHALFAFDYNITRTAEALAVTTPTVRRWIEKHDIVMPTRKSDKNS